MKFTDAVYQFLWGLRDSLKFFHVLIRLYRKEKDEIAEPKKKAPVEEKPLSVLAQRRLALKPELRRPRKKEEEPASDNSILTRLLYCCLLNGFIFAGTILFFQCLFMPLLGYITMLVLQIHNLEEYAFWRYTSIIMNTLFAFFWIFPVFLISKGVNALWSQDIANLSYVPPPKKKMRSSGLESISMMIADISFSMLVLTLFLVQAALIAFIPLPGISHVISMFHLTLLYALYAYEYKWIKNGASVSERISRVEHCWAYFVGFGLPLTLLSSCSGNFIFEGCTFAILFPLFIISANEAHSPADLPTYRHNTTPLKVFYPSVALTNYIFEKFSSRAINSQKERQRRLSMQNERQDEHKDEFRFTNQSEPNLNE